MAKPSQLVNPTQDVSSQNANSQNAKRDEVLKRMLKMKPQRHAKEVSQQLNLSDEQEYSDANISKGNKRSL